MIPHPANRPWRLSCALLVLTLAGPVSPLPAASAARKSFDVPAGRALDTLKAFVTQSGEQLLYSADAVAEVNTRPLKGDFTAREALERMTAGTALAVVSDRTNGALSLVRIPAPNGVGVASTPTRNAAPSPAPAVDLPETVVLSPFVVESQADRGYQATQTLVGTRLRSEVKDVATSLSILTEQFLDDIGANSFTDALAFVPNTAGFRGDDATDDSGNSLRLDSSFSVRGIQSTFKSRNFFITNISPDRYNTDRFSFARGPNGLLFGIGNPGGGVLIETNRAGFRPEQSLRFVSTSLGTRRGTLDVNRPLRPDRLALRASILWEEQENHREPGFSHRRSAFFTGTWHPLGRKGGLSLRAEGEIGSLDQSVPRPYANWDIYSTWANAGGLLSTARTQTPAGTANVTGIVRIMNPPVNGYRVPTLVWTGFKTGATPNLGGDAIARAFYPSFARDYTFRNPLDVLRQHFGSPAATEAWLAGLGPARAIPEQWRDRQLTLPFSASITGAGDRADATFEVGSLFLEHRFRPDFFIEIAGSAEHRDRSDLSSLRPTDVSIKVDPNLFLPNGQPNPHAGFPYIESTQFSIWTRGDDDLAQYRAMAFYELNLRKRSSGRVDFGRHQLVGTYQYSWARNTNLQQRPHFTSGPGVNANNLSAAINRVHPRYYLAPGSNPWLPATPAIAPFTEDGYSARWFNTVGSYSTNTIASASIAAQSFFFKERLVLVYGLRRDQSSVQGSSFPSLPTLELDFANRRSLPAVDSHTRSGTISGVYHVTDWLSLWGTNTKNFQPRSNNNVDINNRLMPPEEGQGLDVGLRFRSSGGKVSGSLARFQTVLDRRSALTQVRGNMDDFMDQLWTIVDPSQRLVSPYSGAPQWLGIFSTESSGYELELIANPFRQLRIRGTVGHIKTSVRDQIAEVQAYSETHRPAWVAYAGNPANPATARAQVQSLIGLWDTDLISFRSEVGARQLRQSPWNTSLALNYDLPESSLLRGVAIGLSHRWQDRPRIGYGIDAAGKTDRNRIDFGPETSIFGGWISYRRKLWRNQVAWTVQLNADNLFDDDTAVPIRSLPFGGTFTRVRYFLPEPRKLTLTSTFRL